jgi:hypothetical protein
MLSKFISVLFLYSTFSNVHILKFLYTADRFQIKIFLSMIDWLFVIVLNFILQLFVTLPAYYHHFRTSALVMVAQPTT